MTFNDLNYPLCFLLTLFFLANGETCQKTTNEFENHLGTKTPYRINANFSTSEIKFEGCKPTKIWALIRHGTRNPDLKLVERMRNRLSELRDLILENVEVASSKINNIDLDLFRAWNFKVQGKDEKKLTHEGEDEMLLLAERFQSRFPQVLGPVYSDTAYKFKFTSSQRTKRSALAFAAGLFGRNVAKDVQFPEPLQRDPVLRFYKLCNKWRRNIKKNPAALEEMRKFQDSLFMDKVIDDVNIRLGLDHDLDISDLHTMYLTCAFETAWNKRKRSPWCAAFSLENFKVMEYAEDLKYFWIDGYGHEITYKQACPAANDLYDFFQNQEAYPKATFYFTHSGTLLKMLAFLGLYKDENPLLASDFAKNAERKWRVSRIDSFGTNLAFVLFDCQGQKKVLTLHQEKMVRLPSCPDSDLCDFEKLLHYYNGNQTCPFDEMCENTQ